jgi:hypothetical protein
MFDMASERTITLRGGRFDGKVVEVDPKAREFWAYMNMYNTPRAVIAGGLPRCESMATYRLVDGADVAEFVEGA